MVIRYRIKINDIRLRIKDQFFNNITLYYMCKKIEIYILKNIWRVKTPIMSMLIGIIGTFYFSLICNKENNLLILLNLFK